MNSKINALTTFCARSLSLANLDFIDVNLHQRTTVDWISPCEKNKLEHHVIIINSICHTLARSISYETHKKKYLQIIWKVRARLAANDVKRKTYNIALVPFKNLYADNKLKINKEKPRTNRIFNLQFQWDLFSFFIIFNLLNNTCKVISLLFNQ